MEHQTYKRMKETWFLVSKELKSNRIRKKNVSSAETREGGGSGDCAVGTQRRFRHISQRTSTLTVTLRVRGFARWEQ